MNLVEQFLYVLYPCLSCAERRAVGGWGREAAKRSSVTHTHTHTHTHKPKLAQTVHALKETERPERVGAAKKEKRDYRERESE